MTRIWIALAAVAALAAGAAFGGYRLGDTHGRAAGIEIANAALAARDAAEAQTAAVAASLAEAQAMTERARAESARRMEAGAAAVRQAQEDERDATRTLHAWMERYAEAARSADCQTVAEAMLCAALRDY